METTYKDSVMIALLPIQTDWSTLECPHLTLVYSGKIEDHKAGDFNEMAKDTGALAMMNNRLSLEVLSIEKMGDEAEPVDALIFRPKAELTSMRRFVESWNKSEYKSFKPHATIGPSPSKIDYPPRQVVFDRIGVFWGEDSIVFRLN